MAEWFKAAVLKTVGSETGPGVRIPLSPPTSCGLNCSYGKKVMFRSRAVVIAIAILSALAPLSGQGNVEKLKDPAQLTERAPDLFRARFDTSQGLFVIAVERKWAPLAADRFYNLVKNGFYNETRFFRVLDGFMAQFGLHADPSCNRRGNRRT